MDCGDTACHTKFKHSTYHAESTPYWSPAVRENELRAQLRMLNVPEIDPSSLI